MNKKSKVRGVKILIFNKFFVSIDCEEVIDKILFIIKLVCCVNNFIS